ncbi:MAG TPA: DEAD/DEAH box helicase [Ramlibacter sp.]|nr:DEAD/DEAH box helicase [Ramlibacter sp.]
MSEGRFLLDPQSLSAKVSQATFDRGLAVYRNQQVLDFQILGANSREWGIEGEVQGSGREIYEVSVMVETSPLGQITFFSGDCSCPVGSNCKHSVALTLKAAYKSGGLRTPAPTAAPAPNAAELQARRETLERDALERERQQSQHKVRQWLDLFGDDPAGGAATPGERTSAAYPGDEDQLVYMLIPGRQGVLPVLQLGAGLTRRLRNGKWAKVKQPRYFNGRGATAQDTEIGRLIASMGAQSYGYSYSSQQGVVAGQTGLLALQMAAATGRLFSISDERVLDQPIAWGPARPLAWGWSEVTSPTAAEPLWALKPRLADTHSDADWFGNTPPLYLDAATGQCGPLETPGMSLEHLSLLLKAPPIPQSAFALHEATLLRRLAGLPLPPVLKAPELLQGVAPIRRLQIAPVPAHEAAQLGLLCATLRFDYDGLRHYARGHINPVLVDRASPSSAGREVPAADVQRVLLHRDLAAEHAAESALHALGLSGDATGRFHRPFASAAQQQAWLHWADADFAPLREAGFVLDVDPRLADWIARADTLEVQLAPQGGDPETDDLAGGDDSRSPWFDLSLGMDIGGQRHNILPLLPELLAQLGAARHGQGATGADPATSTLQLPPYVYLRQSGGNFLRLPTEPLRPWLQALLDLVGERHVALDGDSLRLSRLEALRMGAALGEGAHWQGADSLRHMVQQLAGRSALPEVDAPAGLLAELRPYQRQGLEWLQFLRANGLAGILADDMGLGKTLQTLAHILVEKQAGRLDRPALIIAPVSLMGNWRREAARFAPELRALVLHGSQRHEAAADVARHDLVIAPYSLLQRDRERWLKQAWHLVVLDEAQNIKNANTHAAQIVAELDTRHRLCLSGTPMENHLGELWSLFHFLMPGFLGSQARFKELFRTPIEKHGDSERLDQLRRRITPFMLRRAKREVATDLPEKQEAISSVELGDKQADLYETIRLTTEKAVREALSNKGLAKSQIQILDALLKLRQVCCDPRLVPVAAAKKIKQSAKLELLMELLPEMLAEGRRVLLFSQFTSMLELIEQELQKRDIPWVKLTGQSQKRDELIERFTSGAVPLFLISLKAGGVGLNLTQADTVIHYDPWWNPAVENQATDRAHRIGQTQQVFVYKLVAQGTIEERILALQERKAALADSMYSEAAARKQPLFTEGDLAELLRPLGA